MRIIVVDDEMSALNTFMCNIADKPDVTCSIFRNEPLNALDYARKNAFDVAFLDINMPQINGVELAEELIKINNKVNIVFISGFEQNEAGIRDRIGENFYGFYHKPYSTEEMNLLIDTLRGTSPKVKIVTFGSFNLFVNGETVYFSCKKSKELLALLVNENGGFVSMGNILSMLWEDKAPELAKRLYKDAAFRLRKTLTDHRVESLVSFGRAKLAVRTEDVECDYWEYQKSDTHTYNGKYMDDYQWSIDTQMYLDGLYPNVEND